MRRIETLAAALALALAGPLLAEETGGGEAPPPVRRFVERMYSPHRDGLKDLSVSLDTPLTRGNKVFQHIKIVIFVKTPERHCLDIQGLPDETRKLFLQQLKPLSTLTRYLFCLGAILEKVLAGSDLDVRREDGLHRIEARPRSEALRREFASMTLWLDEESRPVRLDQESAEIGKVSIRVKTEEKEGRLLLSELAVAGLAGVKGEIVAKIAYEKVGAFWFASSVAMSKAEPGKAAGDGKKPEETFLLRDYKVNEGVDDEVFRKVEALAAADRKARASASMQALRKALEARRAAAGAYPELLSELADPPKDPWGRDFFYKKTGETFILRCLGADGREGGEGEDADFE
ncbi:MAG: type II secretion system protein GspG [Planctomycetes bacterium]|jgi:hypothetical protein|nr:type II secretion system protein GspG [Planctomycetota bacterium]